MSEDKNKDCLDPENNSKYCFFKVANAFLLLANLLLIILGFHYIPTCLSEDSSYFSVIVAVLGILVTVLITWQIWQTIISRREVEKATKTANRLNKLESELNRQRNLYESRNLEIKHLIDAHARLHEAENTEDLGGKYILYIEAIEKLIQSKMDISYEQFENARAGLMSTVNAFQGLKDIDEIEDFISREREYEWYYKHLMSQLKTHSDDIDRLRRQLTDLRDFRAAAIADMKKSDIGKRIERMAAEREKEMRELEKSLREKYAQSEAPSNNSSESNGNPS